jgi:hypothetical protein
MLHTKIKIRKVYVTNSEEEKDCACYPQVM